MTDKLRERYDQMKNILRRMRDERIARKEKIMEAALRSGISSAQYSGLESGRFLEMIRDEALEEAASKFDDAQTYPYVAKTIRELKTNSE